MKTAVYTHVYPGFAGTGHVVTHLRWADTVSITTRGIDDGHDGLHAFDTKTPLFGHVQYLCVPKVLETIEVGHSATQSPTRRYPVHTFEVIIALIIIEFKVAEYVAKFVMFDNNDALLVNKLLYMSFWFDFK